MAIKTAPLLHTLKKLTNTQNKPIHYTMDTIRITGEIKQLTKRESLHFCSSCKIDWDIFPLFISQGD